MVLPEIEIAQARLGLNGLRYGESNDWEIWYGVLGDVSQSDQRLEDLAGSAAEAVLDEFETLTVAECEMADRLLKRIGTFYEGPSIDSHIERLLETIETRTWWKTSDACEGQRVLHGAVAHAIGPGGNDTDARVGRLGDDLLRASDQLEDHLEQTIYFRGVRMMAPTSPAPKLDQLAGVLAELSEDDPHEEIAVELEIDLMFARLALAAARGLSAAQAANEPYGITPRLVGRANLLKKIRGREYFAEWMALSPTVAAVEEVLRPIMGALPRAASLGLASWAEAVGQTKRTHLATDVVGWPVDGSRVVRILARAGINEPEVLTAVRKALPRARSWERRKDLSRSAKAVRPQSPVGVAKTFDIATWLIRTGKHGDFDLAQEFTNVLPPNDDQALAFAKKLSEARAKHNWAIRDYTRRFISASQPARVG